MVALVIAEHDNRHLKPATLNTVSAALQADKEVHVLVIGHQVQNVVESAKAIQGVSKVLVADHAAYENFLAEAVTPAVLSIAKNYTHLLAPATTFGKDFMPRVAVLLDVAQISDVLAVVSPDSFKRPIYAGNAIATVQSKDSIKAMTVRITGFAKAPATGGSAAVENVSFVPAAVASRFVSRQVTESTRPELTSARIVISGGRGVGSAENFKKVEHLADKLGAAVGASRAAVDAGYVPNDYQVGQTGKIVAPELYMALGISGAIQHLAGMKDSKIIVAVNKDENAPIFEVADYGLVMDLFQAMEEIEGLV